MVARYPDKDNLYESGKYSGFLMRIYFAIFKLP